MNINLVYTYYFYAQMAHYIIYRFLTVYAVQLSFLYSLHLTVLPSCALSYL